MSDKPKPNFRLTIPRPDGTPLDLEVEAGQVVFVLGANGTGKSGLTQRFFAAHHRQARRVAAHRQTWFESSASSVSPKQRLDMEQSMASHDQREDARWTDRYSTQKPTIALYDVVDAENVRARAIAAAADAGDLDRVQELVWKDAPLAIINELLRLSSIDIELSIGDSQEVFARKAGGEPYPAERLSDGERNALLIAATVLTVKPGTLILIDEPERHLHRSIISPLLTLLFQKRPDCAFVASTHDLTLPLDNPDARTVLLRGCTVDGERTVAWDADVVAAGTEIDDDLKRDLLGARRTVLFVEGSAHSLDMPLYGLLFPGASVIAKGNCRQVEQTVAAISEAKHLHWVRAFGIVDGDGRPEAEIDTLRAKGVHAVPGFSVESLYYEVEVQRRIAQRHAEVTGEDAAALAEGAKEAALAALRSCAPRLAERTAKQLVRERFLDYLPPGNDWSPTTPIDVQIDVPAIVASEKERLDTLLDAGDLPAIIARYPVRETPALTVIAAKLGFRDRGQYEGAVQRLLMDDAKALSLLRSCFGSLAAEIATG